MRRRFDLTSLVAGVLIATLGVLLALTAGDRIDLALGDFWPLLLAAAGAILLASGIRRRQR